MLRIDEAEQADLDQAMQKRGVEDAKLRQALVAESAIEAFVKPNSSFS